jgi:hypothetical protein
MAEWKKVVVSGSAISQLNNDAGYLTTGTLGDFVSGSGGAARTKLNALTSTVLGYVETMDQNVGTGNNVTFTDLDLDGDLAINTNKFTVANATGNTVVAGTLNVTSGITGSLKGNVDGNLTGTADTASVAVKLTTPRSFTTTGDVVIASTNFDGSANFSAAATIQAGAVENTMFAANAKTAISGASTTLSSSLAGRITQLDLASYDLNIAADTGTAGVITNAETFTISGGSNIDTEVDTNEITVTLASRISLTDVTASLKGNVVGNVTGNLTGTGSFATKAATLHTGATGVDLTLSGNLTVNGTTTTVNTTNLEVKDQFINLNDGGGAADGGLVIEGQGTAFGWDESASRWAFDFAGATSNQTTIGADAYAAAVVTTDDSNYRKNGNIRVTAGEVFIYVE